MKFFNFLKKNKIVWQMLLLSAIAAAVYFGNFTNNYSYFDDYAEIVNNKYVNPSQSGISALFTDIQSFHFYVPLKHLVNYFLNSVALLNPHISHLFSDMLHIFNILLCYLVILRLSKSYRIAFLTALFFAVSPVCSNAVNEIAARGHLFTAFFALASFFFYMLADSSGLKHNQDKHFLVLSIVLYFAGLFFWPTIIVLPALFIVYEFAKQDKMPLKKMFLKIFPFALSALIVIALNLYISHLRHSQQTQAAVFDNGMIFSLNLLGQSAIYKIPALLAQYIIYCFVPPFFDIVYSPPLEAFSQNPVFYLLRFAVLAVYAAVCVIIYKKNKFMSLAPAFFIFFLLPGIVFMYKTELMSLRYMYIASIGIFFALFAILEFYVFPYLKGNKKYIAILIIGLFFIFSTVNSFARKYMWAGPSKVTTSMLGNGGMAEVWGWFLKINWEPDLNMKLQYMQQAKKTLEQNKKGYELSYELIDQNISGRVHYINNALSKNKKS